MSRQSAPPTSVAAASGEVERATRVFVAITDQVAGEIDTPISPAGLRALLVLADHDGCTLSDLAHRLPLSQSATSRMVERLVSAGLVERTPSAGDRRQVSVTVCPAGHALTRDFIGRRRAAIRAVVEGMTGEDLDALRRGLRVFADQAHALEHR